MVDTLVKNKLFYALILSSCDNLTVADQAAQDQKTGVMVIYPTMATSGCGEVDRPEANLKQIDSSFKNTVLGRDPVHVDGINASVGELGKKRRRDAYVDVIVDDCRVRS